MGNLLWLPLQEEAQAEGSGACATLHLLCPLPLILLEVQQDPCRPADKGDFNLRLAAVSAH